jgi:antitoxin component of MazEF toxin-antitoxin module
VARFGLSQHLSLPATLTSRIKLKDEDEMLRVNVKVENKGEGAVASAF